MITKRNFNIEDSQYEWLRKKAFDERTNQSAVLRGILDRAMAAENKEATAVTIANLIQAVEEGRTLRQVLEAAHGKPAEEIGTEGQDLAEYQHDLDSPITAIYTAASDIALVAGETVWQDCDTMSVVSSADILADEVFRRTWSQVYPDTRVRIAIVEAGDSYALRIADIDAELTGDTTQELVEQAKVEVAKRGYRVMPDEEGGCCEYCQEIDAYGTVQESIAITVYPEEPTRA